MSTLSTAKAISSQVGYFPYVSYNTLHKLDSSLSYLGLDTLLSRDLGNLEGTWLETLFLNIGLHWISNFLSKNHPHKTWPALPLYSSSLVYIISLVKNEPLNESYWYYDEAWRITFFDKVIEHSQKKIRLIASLGLYTNDGPYLEILVNLIES